MSASSARTERSRLPELYDRFAPTAYSLAISVTHHPQSAERIVAAAFSTAWRRYEHELGSIPTFFADLMNSVRASAFSQVPNQSSQKAFADSAATAGSLADAVTAALGELGPDERQTLALAYFGGLQLNDIASRLQQPLPAVKSQLTSALMHVRSKLGNASVGMVSV
ncbi:MAG: sigma factor-like helix-turn-helix DNA-binding protein [Gemmatimonadota bacterium]